jgi:ADP-heptose:LPS heptosyltransferase
VVFTTPLLAALSQALPAARLYYAVEPAASAIVQDNPHLHSVIRVPRRRGWRRILDDMRLGIALRRERFDVAIDLHGGPRSAWLTWASRAPMRIGYDIPGRAWMYTHPIHRTPEPSVRHSVLNQWDLLAPLGVRSTPDPSEFPVAMYDRGDASRRVSEKLTALGLNNFSELVLIHVSASNPFKRWPASAFVRVAVDLLRAHPSRAAVVVSGPSEPEAAGTIIREARAILGAEGQRIAAPQVDLLELRALSERSAVYIGGDSGPLHVASTTGTPIVELLGPTVASRSFPWRAPRHFAETVDAGPLPCRPCNERVCVPGDFRCLARITPERVIAAAERALASRPTSRLA